MPGMMDTVLNLGLNDETVEGLAKGTGNPRFAYDSYRRFISMFGDVVMGVDPQAFEDALTDQEGGSRRRARHRPHRRRPARPHASASRRSWPSTPASSSRPIP